MISQRVFDHRHEYAARFATEQPFRHVVIDDFLDPDVCQELLAAFPSFEDRYALNEMGRIGNKAVRTDVDQLTDVYRELDAQVRSPAFLDLVSTITGIPDLRYDPDYIGGGTHENRDGQGLDPHIDFNLLPGRRWHRRLNLIIYLNPVWDEAWGGCLELHSNPWSPQENQRKRFAPDFNRCVIFETNEKSWHGFETIRLPPERAGLSRKSFAIYLYTEQRPEQEIAPSHATVYVPSGMPEALRPGVQLDAAWHADLERRFGHMLGQLKFLYDRELEFSAQIERQQQALAECSAALKLDLQGYVVQEPGSSKGLWPDGWIGRELSLRFTPTAAAKSLRLACWVPAAMTGPQELSVRLGEISDRLVITPGRTGELTLTLPLPAGRTVELQISASRTWRPASDGSHGDQRELAFRIASAVLRH